MALKDVETQKDNLDNLLKEKGLTEAQYDEETGYVTNIGDILREAETAKNNAAIEYNKKVDEGLTGEDDDKKNDKKNSKTTKKDITHEYDINYDVHDNLIKAKEKELKRLQEFEENLTGEGLKENLE